MIKQIQNNEKLMVLISDRKVSLLVIALCIIFFQCERKQKANEYDPSVPLLGTWAGETSYFIEDADTIKVIENTERFLVLRDSVKYSFFGDNNYTIVPYFHKGDTFRIKNINSIILELNEEQLIRKSIVSDSKYWIFICKRES